MGKPKPPTRAARSRPAAPDAPAPANDAEPRGAPNDVLAPLFDVPDEGIRIPLAVVERIEVYRFAEQSTGKLVPAFTMVLPNTATEMDIVAARGGGKYLLRAKDAGGAIVGARRFDVEGDPIEPGTSAAGKGGRVESVPGGAGMRLAISGLSAEQQQQWLMFQQVAEERRREAEERAEREAERHSRDLQRLETQNKQTLELVASVFGSARGRPEDESSTVRELRNALKAERDEVNRLRLELFQTQQKLMSATIDFNAAEGDGQGVELVTTLIENADKIGDLLKIAGLSRKAGPKKLGAGATGASGASGANGAGDA